MRIRSDLWVAGYLRGCASAAVPAMLMRRGDAESGAIYIKVNFLDGRASLYGPAPIGAADADVERRWMQLRDAEPEPAIDGYLAEQRNFDPDIFVIEIESRTGAHRLDDWLVKA
jgi:hypothetical protein